MTQVSKEIFDGILELSQDKNFIDELDGIIQETMEPDERNYVKFIFPNKIKFRDTFIEVLYKVLVEHEFSSTWNFLYPVQFDYKGEVL